MLMRLRACLIYQGVEYLPRAVKTLEWIDEAATLILKFLMLCKGGSLAILGFMSKLLAVLTLRGARSFVMKLTLVTLG